MRPRSVLVPCLLCKTTSWPDCGYKPCCHFVFRDGCCLCVFPCKNWTAAHRRISHHFHFQRFLCLCVVVCQRQLCVMKIFMHCFVLFKIKNMRVLFFIFVPAGDNHWGQQWQLSDSGRDASACTVLHFLRPLLHHWHHLAVCAAQIKVSYAPCALFLKSHYFGTFSKISQKLTANSANFKPTV